MNISKLSDKELLELQKSLRTEIKKREVCGKYKSEYLVVKKLTELFDEDVFSKGITDGWQGEAYPYFWTNKFERAIFSLCDLTFGNYIAREAKDKRYTAMYMGPAVLPPEIDDKKYGEMINDIFEVMKKYKKGDKE